MFSYLVTTGWIFNISLFENSINQSLKQAINSGREGMAQDGGTRGGTFHGEINHRSESQGWTTACRSMPERHIMSAVEVKVWKKGTPLKTVDYYNMISLRTG